MTLTKEQIKELKFQLNQQIQHLPEDKKVEAQRQIEELSPEALELMLNEQNSSGKSSKSIFRLIVEEKVQSVKIEENSKALAVLDINPISKGHTIVIPKETAISSKQIPPESFILAQGIAERIEKNLKASAVEIQTEKKFGEFIIHIIPSYESPLTLYSERQSSTDSELKEIAKLISSEKKEEKKETPKEIDEEEEEILSMKKRRIA